MASFRLERPTCPCCGSAEGVVLEKTPLALLRLALAAAVGFLLGDCVPVRWRCTKTGRRFTVRSS